MVGVKLLNHFWLGQRVNNWYQSSKTSSFAKQHIVQLKDRYSVYLSCCFVQLQLLAHNTLPLLNW